MVTKNIEDLKILYVAPRYHTNQVPIMRGWSERKCRVMFMAEFEGVSEIHDYVEFMCMKPNWLSKIFFNYIDKKSTPSQAEGKKIKLFIPAFFDTLNNIKKFGPDLVIVRERYLTNFIIYIICKLLKINKSILYVQQPIYKVSESTNPIKEFLKKKMFPEVVFSPVYYIGNRNKKLEKSNIRFIPLVGEKQNINTEKSKKYFVNNTIHFLDIGKYREYKNHFFLIDVFHRLMNKIEGIDFKLTIIGQLSNSDEKEYYNRLNAYIEEKGLQNIIQTRENIPFREMERLYEQQDVLILPSTYESAGMVILEAMQKGLCVVASIYCGVASYLEKYQCGYTFDIQETTELENILMNLINNRELICQVGNKGIEVIQTELSFETYLQELNKLTEEEFDFSIIGNR